MLNKPEPQNKWLYNNKTIDNNTYSSTDSTSVTGESKLARGLKL